MIKCNDYPRIISFLKSEDEIANLNIIGAIENLKDQVFKDPKYKLEIFVDDEESPNGVVVREHEYWYYIYAKNDAFILQAKTELFDAVDEYGVDATDEHVYKLLIENRNKEWEEPCELLFMDKDKFFMPTPQIEIGDGCVDDAELINSHYTYKDEFSLYFIEECLRNRPSSVYRENGVAVGWVLIHRDDSIGIMYIKESHRKKGIAYELSMDIANKVIKSGKIPFIHIGMENEASFKLARKCGYTKEKTIFWFGVKK